MGEDQTKQAIKSTGLKIVQHGYDGTSEALERLSMVSRQHHSEIRSLVEDASSTTPAYTLYEILKAIIQNCFEVLISRPLHPHTLLYLVYSQLFIHEHAMSSTPLDNPCAGTIQRCIAAYVCMA